MATRRTTQSKPSRPRGRAAGRRIRRKPKAPPKARRKAVAIEPGTAVPVASLPPIAPAAGRLGGAAGILALVPSGRDGRALVPQPTAFPWSSICRLTAQFPGGRAFGTGWFVTPRLVVTVGHNIFSNFGNGPLTWIDRVDVELAQDIQAGNGSIYSATDTVFVHPDWESSLSNGFDLGAIKLAQPVPGIAGLGVDIHRAAAMRAGDRVVIAGFPRRVQDRPDGQRLWFHAAPISGVSPLEVRHEVHTTDGQSGSPILLLAGGAPEPYVVGMHTGGASMPQGSLNEGVKMHRNLFQWIEFWLSQ